jgi:hypothetical protein
VSHVHLPHFAEVVVLNNSWDYKMTVEWLPQYLSIIENAKDKHKDLFSIWLSDEGICRYWFHRKVLRVSWVFLEKAYSNIVGCKQSKGNHGKLSLHPSRPLRMLVETVSDCRL